ncbi:MAG: DUF2207 domain-containing protein [Alphaproteobacteria bacterium]|nr:DUF2207 domain-containing protein [Alphaproteobacteria bacterium]
MKYFLSIILLIACLIMPNTTIALAEVQDLLDINHYIKQKGKPYLDGSFVHIDLPEEIKKAEEFKPIPLEIQGTYPIKTSFRKQTTAAFVPHTTDFDSIVQVHDNKDISLNQTIQFINTSSSGTFSRTFDITDGQEYTLLSATRNGTPVQMEIVQTKNTWTITDPQKLSSGIYTYIVSYIIKNALTTQDNTLKISLSLTGPDWPLPVERFSAIILFPQKTNPMKQDLSFGSNNIVIPDGFISNADNNGNLSYTLTRPLPAYADVKINVVLDNTVLTDISFMDKILVYLNHTLFLVCLIVLIGYTLITFLYLKIQKTTAYPLKDLKYYSFVSLRYLNNKPVSLPFLETLVKYESYVKHKDKSAFLFLNAVQSKKSARLSVSLFVFFNVMQKYILTMTALIALTVFQSAHLGFALLPWEIGILIFVAFILLKWLYKMGEKPYIKRKIAHFTTSIFKTDFDFGISNTAKKALFLRFYPYTLVDGKEIAWEDYASKHGLNMQDYPFTSKGTIK